MKAQNLDKLASKNQKNTAEQRSNYSCSLRESLNKHKRTIIGGHKRHDTASNALDRQSNVTADRLRQLNEENNGQKQFDENENVLDLNQEDEVNQEEL